MQDKDVDGQVWQTQSVHIAGPGKGINVHISMQITPALPDPRECISNVVLVLARQGTLSALKGLACKDSL